MDMRERDTCSAWSTRWLTQQARVLFDIKETITRTREEALALIEGIHRRIVMIVIDGLVRVLTMALSCACVCGIEYRRRIVSGATTLAELATTESDCSSAKRGGDLGQFGPGDMQASFEAATYVRYHALDSRSMSLSYAPPYLSRPRGDVYLPRIK